MFICSSTFQAVNNYSISSLAKIKICQDQRSQISGRHNKKRFQQLIIFAAITHGLYAENL